MIKLEVVNFQEEIRRIEKEVKRLGHMEAKEQMNYAAEQLRIVTPVDTGEARSGWKTTESLVDSNFVGTIENPVEHIVYLNRGHSKQAPSYFIEQVLSTIGVITS